MQVQQLKQYSTIIARITYFASHNLTYSNVCYQSHKLEHNTTSTIANTYNSQT